MRAPEFVCWDGEGASDGRRQNYVLLGNNRSDPLIARRLKTVECLHYLCDQAVLYPNATHVGFAFDYDVNMILWQLSVHQFRILRETGHVYHDDFRIEHIPGKWFEVYRRSDKQSIKIQDTFGFFQRSFVTALQQYLPDDEYVSGVLAELQAGKDDRSDFTWSAIEGITTYWKLEIGLFHKLVTSLQDYLYSVGLNIIQWHGPGAIADFVYRKNGVLKAKDITPPEVRQAARYAYSAGRFELFQVGKFDNVYGLDINSAYPAAIAQLPNLIQGEWVHRQGAINKIARFGVYRIKLDKQEFRRPGPVFHRSEHGAISYPHSVEGWYWSPEAQCAKEEGAEILEAWEYVEYTNARPFAFVQNMYNQRLELKRQKSGAQLAIKLALNSLYGKMAQRAGWERNGAAPYWHQLSWAGWVTSYTRAMLYSVMKQIPDKQLIAVETDGIYTTTNPDNLNIEIGEGLGQWDVSKHDVMMYLQSGVYAFLDGGVWGYKYRGLDKGSLNHENFEESLKACVGKHWSPIIGPTTRFVGYPAALQGDDRKFTDRHRQWVTVERELQLGSIGKRQHWASVCEACAHENNGYVEPHSLIIMSQAYNSPHSHMHDIPWEDEEKMQAWREREKHEKGLIGIW